MPPATKSPTPPPPATSAVHPALRVSQAPAVHVPVPRDTSASPAPAPTTSASQPPNPTPLLDAEKLAVYQVALELQALSATLVPPQHRVLRDQMERASLSVVLKRCEKRFELTEVRAKISDEYRFDAPENGIRLKQGIFPALDPLENGYVKAIVEALG